MGSVVDQENNRMVSFAQAKAAVFIEHIKTKYPNDRDVQMLLSNYRGMRMLPQYVNQVRQSINGQQGSINGQTDITTGIIEINPRDPYTKKLRTQQGVLTTVVHEFAHAAHSFDPIKRAHGPEWGATFLKFSDWMRKDLQWDINVPCHYCQYFGGPLCDSASCGSCVWACPGKHAQPTKFFPDSPNPPLWKLPQSTVARVCAKPAYPWLEAMCAQARGGGRGR